MRTVAALCIALGVLFACQGADPTSPSRDLDPAGKKAATGSGTGGSQAAIVLSRGYTSVVGSGGLSTGSRTVTFVTPFLAPFLSTIRVDPDGGATGTNQLPLSGQVNWTHCVWNADIAYPYDPANVPPAAKNLWDQFFGTQASARPRLFFATVDTRANGEASWNHQSLLRWFSRSGSNKFMWEFEVGGESTLSLVQPVASWDGNTFTFSGGIVRATRTLCGSFSGPDGCVPARGKGNRPTVVCRNDGLAFPAVTYAAEVQ